MASKEITPGQILAIVKRRMWAFLVPAVLVFLVFAMIAIALPPVYKTSSTILIEQQDIPTDFVRTTVSTYAEQQLQIIRQRIMTTTKLLEIINRYGLYQDLRKKKTTEEVVDTMRNDIALQPISVDVVDPKTGRPVTATIAFTLSYEGKNDPAKIQQIANVLTSLYLEENVRTREQQASDITKFIEEEMNRVKGTLTTIDSKLTKYKEAHVNELPELMQMNMQSLSNLDRERELLNGNLVHLKEQEGALKIQIEGARQELKERNRDRLEELKVHLIQLRNQFSDKYPDVVRTKSEIEQLEKSLEKSQGNGGPSLSSNPVVINLSSQLSGVQSEIATVESQLHDLDRQKVEYDGRIRATPQVESEYTAILLEKNNTQAKYDDLMKKLMEARSSQSLEAGQKGERFTLIEPAILPEKPYKPNRLAILIIGLTAGLGIGGIAASAREFMDSSFKNSTDLTEMFGSGAVLASVPRISTGEDEKRKRKRTYQAAGLAIAVLIAGTALFHVFFMKLDLFLALLMSRMGF